MTCPGCGADLGVLAVALSRRHVPCCHQQAFVTISAELTRLVGTCSGIPERAREDAAQEVLSRLWRSDHQLDAERAAWSYLRRALFNAWIDTQRREQREPAPLGDTDEGLATPEDQLVAWAEATEPGSSETTLGPIEPGFVVRELEAHLEPASKRLRGASAQGTFVRVMQGLIDKCLKRTAKQKQLRAAEGLGDSAQDRNNLEARQSRARATYCDYFEGLAEAATDVRTRLLYLGLAEIVVTLLKCSEES